MTKLTETVQTGDWASEKHVPEITIEKCEDGKIKVTAAVGSEIEHPNTQNTTFLGSKYSSKQKMANSQSKFLHMNSTLMAKMMYYQYQAQQASLRQTKKVQFTH